MMRANRPLHPSRVVVACLVLGLSGCAHEALDNQLANSREAVDQAKIAGAAESAPAEYNAALSKLERANTDAQTRDKDAAMRLAREAQVDANLARAKTESVQARYAATQMAKSNFALRESFARANQHH
jgi:hypothetical protein